MEPGHSFKGEFGQQSANEGTTPQEFLKALHEELATFNQPHVDSRSLDNAPLEDVLKDIHRAIYGNGMRASGINWKMAEVSTLLRDTINKHHACRAEMLRHLQEDSLQQMQRRFGLLGIIREYPKIALTVALLLFLGISTVWSIVLQERQVSQTEKMVVTLVEKVVDFKLGKAQ